MLERVYQIGGRLRPRDDDRLDRLFVIGCLCSEVEIATEDGRLVLDGCSE